MNVSDRLARFLAGTETVPDDALEAAKRAVLDTLGVALAGSREESARIAADRAREHAGREESTVLGQGFRAPVGEAAFVNGIAAHALDFDDVSLPMRGHPSAPLLPAVLALGEKTGASGRELLAAFVLGFEVEARLGRAIGESHYAAGWHATSTFGTLGGAAASARLLRLDAAKTQAALGMAASLASGLQANFGSMTKHLHVGHAARSGLEAAELASRGFTADAGAVHAFLRLMAAGVEPDLSPFDSLGDPYEIVSSGVAVKLYPCCYATHRALDAALELRERRDIDPAAVQRVDVEVSGGGLLPLRDSPPATGLEGKFSMEYCLAAALADGRVTLDTFSDEAVTRPAVRDLMAKVMATEGAEHGDFPIGGYADLRIALRDGAEHRLRVDTPRGDPSRPLSWDDLAAKFRDCAALALSSDGVERVLAMVERLEDLPNVSELGDALLLPARGEPARPERSRRVEPRGHENNPRR
ncbi:MAG: MmgE/PrpD family protein [Dehalococcoidia bacterium]